MHTLPIILCFLAGYNLQYLSELIMPFMDVNNRVACGIVVILIYIVSEITKDIIDMMDCE